MRKLVYFILFIVAAAFANAAVNTEYYGKSSKIMASLASQDPDPVEPGKIVELSFKLDNQGTLANDVLFEIMPEYPFSLLPGEEAVKNVGTLGTSQNTDRTVFVKYKILVDQNAVDGNQEIKIRYKIGAFESWTTIDDLTVKVQSHDAILSVDRITAMPEVTAPGSKTRLSISLKNYASSLLKDVKVTLDLGKSGDEATPFSPIGSTNEKVISVIDAQASSIIEFSLLADPDAKSKTYKVPMKIQYSDTLNKNYSKTNTIALVVGVEPDISVYIDTSSIYSSGSTGDLSVKIVNKGLTDVKFLNVNLEKGQGYMALSPYEVYIGNIDSDDYETADFKINVEKTKDKKIILPLTVDYKDANNHDYIKKVNLELPLYTSSEARKLGLVTGSNKAWIFLVIAAVIIGFFAYRRWKRRKK